MIVSRRIVRKVVLGALPLAALVVLGVGLAGEVGPGAAQGPEGFTPAQTWHSAFCFGDETCTVGDVNGDGLDDIVAFIHDTQGQAALGDVWVALSTGSGFGQEFKAHDGFCSDTRDCVVGDVNGDGSADLVAYMRGAGGTEVYVALADGSGYFGNPQVWSNSFCLSAGPCLLGDFNGDARQDLLHVMRNASAPGNVGTASVQFSTGGGVSPQPASIAGEGIFEFYHVGDVNGDGMDDLAAIDQDDLSGNAQISVALSTGAGFNTPTVWHNDFCMFDSAVCTLGDVNGDGVDDAVMFLRDAEPGVMGFSQRQGRIDVALATGASFGQIASQLLGFCVGDEQCHLGDFNGDGRQDALAFVGSAATGNPPGTVYVALSTMTGGMISPPPAPGSGTGDAGSTGGSPGSGTGNATAANADLLLIYDAGVPVFTMQNVSGAPLNLEPLSFRGAGLTVPSSIWAAYTASPLGSFKHIGCLQIWAYGIPDQPAPPECGSARQAWLNDNRYLFWTEGSFEVLYNGAVVTSCTGENARCYVDLPGSAATPAPPPAPPATGDDEPLIIFAANRANIAPGECVTVTWQTANIAEVYYQDQPVTGNESRTECPTRTTTYQLRVILRDGTTTTRSITINIADTRQCRALTIVKTAYFSGDPGFRVEVVEPMSPCGASMSWLDSTQIMLAVEPLWSSSSYEITSSDCDNVQMTHDAANSRKVITLTMPARDCTLVVHRYSTD